MISDFLGIPSITQLGSDVLCWIETAAIATANTIISAIATAITALVAILPSFPSITMPTAISDYFAWCEYWFPLDWFFVELGVFVTLAFTWFGVSIALRWLRAVRGNQ